MAAPYRSAPPPIRSRNIFRKFTTAAMSPSLVDLRRTNCPSAIRIAPHRRGQELSVAAIEELTAVTRPDGLAPTVGRDLEG